MLPTGSSKPVIYILGEAPGQEEDRVGRQFVGKSGAFLRAFIPESWSAEIRWNNCVRSRPPDNRTPTVVELECCRPSVVSDIAATKPKAIFGFGGTALNWVLGGSRPMYLWRGRRIPVTVGGHTCWFFPFHHPSYLLRKRFAASNGKVYPSEDEFVFGLDMKRAIQYLEGSYTPPVVHTKEKLLSGIATYLGRRPAQELEEIRRLFSRLSCGRAVGIDFETSALRPYRDGKVLTVGLAGKDEVSEVVFAFSLDHPESLWPDRCKTKLKQLFLDFLSTYRGVKTVHKLAFEFEWLGVYFARPDLMRVGQWDCTMAMAYCLGSRRAAGSDLSGFGHGGDSGGLSLDFLTTEHFGVSGKSLVTVDRKHLSSADLSRVLLYNAVDARLHLRLHKVLKRRLVTEDLWKFYRDEHLRRISTLVRTQIKSVPLSMPTVISLNGRLSSERDEVLSEFLSLPGVAEFQKKLGTSFSCSKPQHVAGLFSSLGIYPDRLDEGSISKVDHPVAKKFLQVKPYLKLLSTYSDNYSKDSPIVYSHPTFGYCLHPIFNDTSTATGRTSSEQPNGQNLPKRKYAFIRQQFADAAGRYWAISVDYGQLEARVIGALSGCAFLVDSLVHGTYDVHAVWAEKIASAYPRLIGGRKFLRDKSVMKTLRSEVKNKWVFPLFYNATLNKVSSLLGLSAQEASPLFEEFWDDFSGVKSWQQSVDSQYRTLGYIQAVTGRRYLAPLTPNMRANYPVQGPSSDITVNAQNRLSEMEVEELQSNLNVHDDLTFFVPKKKLDVCMEAIITEMLRIPYDFITVPLSVEVSIGPDLYNLRTVGDFRSDRWRF
jgi:uracil-DNA glycosylase family 4